ncbi:MAG: hypothetical protein VZR36_14670, partial [Prevotella sp.]|nr:hypothetical protein [Prevotella sp.]
PTKIPKKYKFSIKMSYLAFKTTRPLDPKGRFACKELVYLPTHQLVNSSTHQLVNSFTCQLVN